MTWWATHVWIPVWAAVVLTPAALLALRLVDDTAVALLVQPILVTLGLLFALVLATAVGAGGRNSLGRGGGALLAAVLLALPMLHVIGRRPCPELMGLDRGLQASTQVFDAWQNGAPPPADVWASAALAHAWTEHVDGVVLREYRLTDSGCWERLAPVTTATTWHEFRVTVDRPDGDLIAKTLIVHTRAVHGGWVVADVEGLDP